MTGVSGIGRASAVYRRLQQRVDAPAPAMPVRGPAVVSELLNELSPKLREAFLTLQAEAEELRRDLTAAKARIRELEQLVDQDDLVPVGNRRSFDRDIRRVLAEVDRHDLHAAVMFVDVDAMKRVNDNYGHAAGDLALVHVAATLRSHLRATDTVARIGGDEFAIILTHVVPEEAQAKARQLAAIVAEAPVAYSGGFFNITVSVGIEMLETGVDISHVLARADERMYADKRKTLLAEESSSAREESGYAE